jgi:heptosyltransferase-3
MEGPRIRQPDPAAPRSRSQAPPTASPGGGLRKAGLYVRSTVKSLRRNSRLALGHLLARITGPRTSAGPLRPDQISSVLVCRINGRIGNTLFLTPLLQRIHELLPHASIDITASNPQAAELLESIPGVRDIIAFPHKGPRLVRRYFGALRKLRAQRYDLAIDPVPESTSGRIAISLCRARYRVGFATGSQWAPLTHAIPETGPMHQGVQPVVLLCRAFNVPCDLNGLQLSLCLRPQELEAGREAVVNAITHMRGPRQAPARAFGFFAHATASKTIERAWWLAFWKAFLELEPEAVPLEFLPTPRTPPLDQRFATLHFPSTRALTAAMAATHLFISADTGPMHLASSTSVPTVALFQATDPAIYGPLKPGDVTIDLTQSTPQQVAHRCQQVWRGLRFRSTSPL